MSNKRNSERTITTANLQLEKPLITDHYDVNVFNRNADKIDEAYSEIMSNVGGLELKAEKVTIADKANSFNATNVEDALAEIQTELVGNKTNLQNNINAIREVL